MVFSLLLFALVGIIAFFQYVQGFFSATISAILATVAAMVAMGWYEQVAPLLFNAKVYEQAAAISLVVIFAVTYIVPRLIIDVLVPGNVRVPFIVEKVGAGLMGLIAALMATGIVAIAADALPFGPTVGMYSRFGVMDDKDKTYQAVNGPMQDTTAFDVFTGDKLSPDDPSLSHVWLRQDDLVAGLVRKVSADTGSLSNQHPFDSVHPDLLDELYGQRLGIQIGAKHVAVNTEQAQPVTVKGVYTPPRPIPQVDGEPTSMRPSGFTPPPPTVTTEADQIVLVVRMGFAGKELADEADGLMRYSAGAVRLVLGAPESGVEFKDYYPVATLDARGVAVAARPDDFLLSDLGSPRTVDFVFVVDRDHAMTGEENKPPFHLPNGSFVAFKRYGVVDLSGKQVEFGPPPNPDKTPVIRKTQIDTLLNKTDGIWTGASPVGEGGSGGGAAAASGDNAQAGAGGQPENGAQAGGEHPVGDSGLSYVDIRSSAQLPVPVSCRNGDSDTNVSIPDTGVTGVLTHRQWSQLDITMTAPVETLGQPPSDVVQQLAVDPNTTLVQVECSAPVSGSLNSMWSWRSHLGDFALADATGKTYSCVGVWATAQKGASHYFVANYKNFDDRNHLAALPVPKGRPVNVWLAFQVPSGTPIAELRYSANTAVGDLNFKAQ
jgi:hypothetical protein